ncbi:hypothetical protein KG112_17285 [Nocardioides sp. zg-ZUI104]|nr:hypothetical protein [Nocardioides faecalis]
MKFDREVSITRSATLGLAVLALALTGCSSAEPTADPVDHDAIVVLTGSEPRSMNCAEVVAYDQMISSAFVERLVFTDADFSPTKDGLVDDWEQTSPRTRKLHAREGVTFSNGEAWNADALKFSLDTHHTTPGAVTAFFAPFKDVQVLDDYTVEVKMDAPNAAVPALLAFGCGLPPDYYSVSGAEGFGKKPVGTGPYVLEAWDLGREVTAKANPKYWGTSRGSRRSPGSSSPTRRRGPTSSSAGAPTSPSASRRSVRRTSLLPATRSSRSRPGTSATSR